MVWVKPPERRGPWGLLGHGLRFTGLDESLSQTLGALLAESL